MPKTTHPDVALIGYGGVGKDTAGDYLVEAYGYTKLAFADPLRELAKFVNPFVDADRTSIRYFDALLGCGYRDAKDAFPEVRRFLDRLGRGVREVLGSEVWVEALAARLDALDPAVPVVVTDVRFPNEVALLEEYGFEVVRLTREGYRALAPSDAALDDYVAPHTVANDGAVEDLVAAFDALVEARPRSLV